MRYDTSFRPSTHGFAFANRWRDTVLGVLASRGRCGGMVFAALDAFLAGVPLTGATQPDGPAGMPAHDSPLARAIWRRQVESATTGLGVNLVRFVRFTYLPAASSLGVAARTRSDLAAVASSLEAGRPVPLGLVSALGLRHIASNHQVLAYAMELTLTHARIRVYDPNLPLRDDVVLEVQLDAEGPVIELIGRRARPYKLWRGAFVEHYRPPLEAAALRERPGSAVGPEGLAEPVLPVAWWLGGVFVAILLALVARRGRRMVWAGATRRSRRGIL